MIRVGMRSTSSFLIYIDLEKALKAGIKFYVSDNGVVLSKGDGDGYIRPKFFKKVTRLGGTPLQGWAEQDVGLKETDATESGSFVPENVSKEDILTDNIEETTKELEDLKV